MIAIAVASMVFHWFGQFSRRGALLTPTTLPVRNPAAVVAGIPVADLGS
jgi:hypothetical protein